MNFPFSKIGQTISEAGTLDDLIEGFLAALLEAEHVRRAELLLFSKRGNLVPVGEASYRRTEEREFRRINSQAWLVDSSIRHTARRVALPNIYPLLQIPLTASGELLGYLRIQASHISAGEKSYMEKLYSCGFLLSSKIREITFQEEIDKLKRELERVISCNKDNQHAITLLSKELYAITAIATKVNQSMNFSKSLQKSVAKVKEVFKAESVALFLKEGATCSQEAAIMEGENAYDLRLLKTLSRQFLREIADPGFPSGDSRQHFHQRKMERIDNGNLKAFLGIPLMSRGTCIGALVLLHGHKEGFGQDNLRLLSGMANIMAMAVENLSLYERKEQKERQSAFLLESFAKFNEQLDLEKTLTSVAEKGAEYVGEGSVVYLLCDTKVPMIKAFHPLNQGRASLGFNPFREMEKPELENFLPRMGKQSGPLLIRNINRARSLDPDLRGFFRNKGMESLMLVPLIMNRKRFGTFLFGKETGAGFFDRNDLSVAVALGGAASVAIENARAHTASLEMSDFLEKKIREKTCQIAQIRQSQETQAENREEIVFRVNKRNRFVFVNKAMEYITGCSKEELYRGDKRAEDVIAEEDRARVKGCFKKILLENTPVLKDLEYRHLNKKGEDHIISLTIYPETDQGGKISGIEGVGRDITYQKRLERELAKAKDLALLGEFSGAVAHQLRNPLGNILMGAKLLERAMDLPHGEIDALLPEPPFQEKRESLKEIFNNLSDGIHNLNRVVTGLLEYTKTMKLSRSTQKIDLILQEVLRAFESELKKQKIELFEDINPEIPPLSLDSVLIGQALQNMIQNAIQAMESGGALYITIDFSSQNSGFISITLSDTGAGIDPSDLEKIFHPLYTTKESGTGLGLSLSHRIVEAHGGMLWACANPCPHDKKKDRWRGRCPPMEGATMHILLPIGAIPEERKGTTP